jgi:hypothetical protein
MGAEPMMAHMVARHGLDENTNILNHLVDYSVQLLTSPRVPAQL